MFRLQFLGATLFGGAMMFGLASSAAERAGLPLNGVARGGAAPAYNAARTREQVLYSFKGGTDGANPWGDLLADKNAALYSTTLSGGKNGLGTAFKLTPSGNRYTDHVLHSFGRGDDGAGPWAGLVADKAGTLYSTTGVGGSRGNGTVFKLAGKREAVLYSFKGAKDGGFPTGFLIADGAGVLYGTTESGGSMKSGTVFSLSPSSSGYTERVLYSFQGGSDGQYPHGGLLEDATGALYGTTVSGGSNGVGTVFKLSPHGSAYQETFVYSFDVTNGELPNANLIADSTGALYGTASWGGSGSCSYGYPGCGVVFKLTPTASGYSESTLYSFHGNDGAGPNGGLFADKNGTIYGTAEHGGPSGYGTVFKLTPHGKGYIEKTLWLFGGANDGASPAAGLIADSTGSLYGTTVHGGTYGEGTVFKVTP